ncbi:CLUMA_CG012646, isoform A [Clunio marinus]|uniref:Ubiquitin-conjugating enzyme E2 J2 n=1 Tax=Clunio marinus TaxID=568069 RepID=A0A1J1IK53_9DIPT|nr:CLUMA_CG012646, isoform A [Clunio marinus]
MSQKSYTSRLKQDYIRLKQDPVPYIHAEFLPSNILEWHYVIQGPKDSPFNGGYYHGSLIFTKDFPFKPPSIYMYTPNGRFKPNKRLCLSISDFHPDTWNPAWSVSTILTGLLSIMLENSPLLGSCESTLYEKKKLAMNSLEFNLKNDTFKELFPDLVSEIQEKLEKINEMKKKNEKEASEKSANETNQLDSATNNGTVYNLCTNVIILVMFGIFICIVKKIYESGEQEE